MKFFRKSRGYKFKYTECKLNKREIIDVITYLKPRTIDRLNEFSKPKLLYIMDNINILSAEQAWRDHYEVTNNS